MPVIVERSNELTLAIFCPGLEKGVCLSPLKKKFLQLLGAIERRGWLTGVTIQMESWDSRRLQALRSCPGEFIICPGQRFTTIGPQKPRMQLGAKPRPQNTNHKIKLSGIWNLILITLFC